jgi:hypothetical protein
MLLAGDGGRPGHPHAGQQHEVDQFDARRDEDEPEHGQEDGRRRVPDGGEHRRDHHEAAEQAGHLAPRPWESGSMPPKRRSRLW